MYADDLSAGIAQNMQKRLTKRYALTIMYAGGRRHDIELRM